MENGKLREQINVVVDARERAREAREIRIVEHEAWAKAHETLFLIEKVSGDVCAHEEGKLRILTLEAFKETGNKQPAIGVGIREPTVLSYDSHKAKEWAVKHEMALSLDKKAFEAIAKTSNLPFVTITNPPQATIATELKKEEK